MMTFEALADVLLRYRLRVVLALVAVSAVAIFGLTRSSFDDQPRGVFRADDEEFQLLEELFEQFGSDENDCILLVSADPLFERSRVAALRQLVARVEKVEGVQEVVSIADPRFVTFQGIPGGFPFCELLLSMHHQLSLFVLQFL